MPSAGGNAFTAGAAFVGLGLMVAAGQPIDGSPVVVTVPLHQAEGRPSSPPSVSVSADGRFVAFVSLARLVASDDNDHADVYVLNRDSGAVSLEAPGSASADAGRPIISATGHYLLYDAQSDGDSLAVQVLMIRDRQSGAARPLQRGGVPPNGPSRLAAISADERYAAFTSSATNLVDGPDANGRAEDVYIADLASMDMRRVSTDRAAVQSADGSSFAPSISDDGRFVAFTSSARLDAVAGDSLRGRPNIYVKDLQSGATTRVSVGAGGRAADGPSYAPAISGDGHYVAFVSEATNLGRRRYDHGAANVYVRDLATRVTDLVSRTPAGSPGNGPSGYPSISADGRFVVFQSDASDLTCGEHCPSADRDINLVTDIFRFDRSSGRTERISRGRLPWMEPSIGPAMDRSGAVIAFASRHPLDQADDRHDYDLFVWAKRIGR
jgi:Tol biopolymer transport system component